MSHEHEELGHRVYIEGDAPLRWIDQNIHKLTIIVSVMCVLPILVGLVLRNFALIGWAVLFALVVGSIMWFVRWRAEESAAKNRETRTSVQNSALHQSFQAMTCSEGEVERRAAKWQAEDEAVRNAADHVKAAQAAEDEAARLKRQSSGPPTDFRQRRKKVIDRHVKPSVELDTEDKRSK